MIWFPIFELFKILILFQFILVFNFVKCIHFLMWLYYEDTSYFKNDNGILNSSFQWLSHLPHIKIAVSVYLFIGPLTLYLVSCPFEVSVKGVESQVFKVLPYPWHFVRCSKIVCYFPFREKEVSSFMCNFSSLLLYLWKQRVSI